MSTASSSTNLYPKTRVKKNQFKLYTATDHWEGEKNPLAMPD